MEAYYKSDAPNDIIKYLSMAHQKMKVVCPNCQADMLQVHYNFEVPAQRDVKSWKTLKKTLTREARLSYDTYIHWHRSEIQKTTENSPKHVRLKQNLEKLKQVVSIN